MRHVFTEQLRRAKLRAAVDPHQEALILLELRAPTLAETPPDGDAAIEMPGVGCIRHSGLGAFVDP